MNAKEVLREAHQLRAIEEREAWLEHHGLPSKYQYLSDQQKQKVQALLGPFSQAFNEPNVGAVMYCDVLLMCCGLLLMDCHVLCCVVMVGV